MSQTQPTRPPWSAWGRPLAGGRASRLKGRKLLFAAPDRAAVGCLVYDFTRYRRCHVHFGGGCLLTLRSTPTLCCRFILSVCLSPSSQTRSPSLARRNLPCNRCKHLSPLQKRHWRRRKLTCRRPYRRWLPLKQLSHRDASRCVVNDCGVGVHKIVVSSTQGYLLSSHVSQSSTEAALTSTHTHCASWCPRMWH